MINALGLESRTNKPQLKNIKQTKIGNHSIFESKNDNSKQTIFTPQNIAIATGAVVGLAVIGDFVFAKGKHVKAIGEKIKNLFSSGNNTKAIETSEEIIEKADTEAYRKLQSLLEANKYTDWNREFCRELYKLGENKFNFIANYPYFSGSKRFSGDEFLEIAKKIPEQDLKTTFNEIEELFKTLPKVNFGQGEVLREPHWHDMMNLTILKHHNKEAYEYLLNYPNKGKLDGFIHKLTERLEGSAFQTLTIPQIRQIEGVGCIKNSITGELSLKGYSAFNQYVECSDVIARDAEKSKVLSEYLSATTISEEFTALRGERDTGMFNSVVLDKKMVWKTKWNVIKNMFKAKKVQVHDYTGNYETTFSKKTNLFKYIMGKKELTLADAMQTAKYGGESYRNQVIEMIKNSEIVDTRFKSLTFDRKMAQGWIPTQGSSNTGVLQHLTVKKGLEGIYSYVNNNQAEFVLNNSAKSMTFQDVVYDAVRDLFVTKTTIKPT